PRPLTYLMKSAAGSRPDAHMHQRLRYELYPATCHVDPEAVLRVLERCECFVEAADALVQIAFDSESAAASVGKVRRVPCRLDFCVLCVVGVVCAERCRSVEPRKIDAARHAIEPAQGFGY